MNFWNVVVNVVASITLISDGVVPVLIRVGGIASIGLKISFPRDIGEPARSDDSAESSASLTRKGEPRGGRSLECQCSKVDVQ